ncbi:NADPH--cytochrome P450 reductase [Geodia barretti]|nr:NADPH--cytochrome P450 reductase [Geodia barretti]
MGVATGWLKRHQQKVQNGEVVLAPISIRHSSLRLPYHSSKPVIMVGPGTGLAPFRGFIQDRAAAKQSGIYSLTLHMCCMLTQRHIGRSPFCP